MVNRFDEGGFRGFGSPGLFGGFGGFGGSPQARKRSGFFGSDLPFGGGFDDVFGSGPTRNLFSDPSFAFEASLGEAGLPRHMVDFFRNKAGGFLKDFNQLQAQRLREAGQVLSPREHFENFDFRSEALKFSPKVRGEGIAAFNPRTVFFNR